jgi:hydrogenase maturation factor
MIVVANVFTVIEAGWVTAMPDAKVDGLIYERHEIAAASAGGREVDGAFFVFLQEVHAICEALHCELIAAIAEGSLLITADQRL